MEDNIEPEPMAPRFQNDRAVLQLILEHIDETNVEFMKRVDILLQKKAYGSLTPEEKRLVETFEDWHDIFGKQTLNKLFDRIMLMKELCGENKKLHRPKEPAPERKKRKPSEGDEVPKDCGFQKASTLKKWGA